MNSTFCTPKKVAASGSTSFLFSEHQQHHHHHTASLSSSGGGGTSSSNSSNFRTPGSVKRSGRFHLLPLMNRTPISRLNRVIVNPFEASLTERLHLPMICSPSLFHRPATPQMSSTQFEWTIEDVASLGPANVEADETQFIVQTDPEIEARAQEAITSYFRDNVVLPSPINCPLREAAAKMKLLPDESSRDSLDNHRQVELEEESAKKKRKTRDGTAQTVLTFPPRLPREVEEMLAQFCTFTQDQQQSQEDQYNDSSNASLRRKLFETSLNSDDLGVSSHEADEEEERRQQLRQRQMLREVAPTMGTPELNLEVKTRTRHFGSPTDNHLELSETKKESFGSLSPILSSTGSTPGQLGNVIDVEAMAGASSSTNNKMHRHHSSSTSSLYRSTPERLSQRSVSISSVEMSSVHGSAMKARKEVAARGNLEGDSPSDDSVEDEMQVSHWSDMNVTTASRSMFFSQPMPGQDQEHELQRTPVRRHNRSASRKNLSRSFSQILNEEFGDEVDEVRRALPTIHPELIGDEAAVMDEEDVFVVGNGQRQLLFQDQRRLFVRTLSAASDSNNCRTDSGFNDDDLTSSSSARSGQPSFSTPTTKLLYPHQLRALATNSEDVSMRSFSCD